MKEINDLSQFHTEEEIEVIEKLLELSRKDYEAGRYMTLEEMYASLDKGKKESNREREEIAQRAIKVNE